MQCGSETAAAAAAAPTCCKHSRPIGFQHVQQAFWQQRPKVAALHQWQSSSHLCWAPAESGSVCVCACVFVFMWMCVIWIHIHGFDLCNLCIALLTCATSPPWLGWGLKNAPIHCPSVFPRQGGGARTGGAWGVCVFTCMHHTAMVPTAAPEGLHQVCCLEQSSQLCQVAATVG